jgi:hypothetical protein
VAPKNQPVLEAKEQVLADGLDPQQPAPVEPVRNARHPGAWMRRLDLEALADENLQASGHAMKCITFGHCSKRMHPRWKSTAAGAVAALVWGAIEPLDMRLFRYDYSDVAVLGKTLTRGRGWRPLGLAMHALNGAVFGLAFDEARRRLPVEPRRLALGMALAEHLALYPLGYFVDRHHPARGEPGVARLLHARAFAQATFRHALFGVLLSLGAEDRAAPAR